MLLLSIIFLFLFNLPGLFGTLHKKQTSHLQPNGLEVRRGDLRATSIDIASEKTGLEVRIIDGDAQKTGIKLGECYGGTGRWLSRKLSSKNPRKNQMCYCRCSTGSSKNAALANKECYECLKSEGRDGSATVGSTDGASITEFPVSLQRSSTTLTQATKSTLGSHQYTVFDSMQRQGGRAKKTYRSKDGGNWLPRTSTKSPSDLGCCDRCFGKSCLVFCEILKPICYCLALPCLCLDACCQRSCKPCDDYLTSIYPP